jgi:hypothetical protein
MNEKRRKFLAMGAATIGTIGLPLTMEAMAETKPLTSEDLASTLIRLSGRARKSEMPHAAELLRELAAKVLQGEPVVPCTTDSDCERKNPRLSSKKVQ